jgi:5-methylcytosine-specific restriction endonuclease McrA
MNEMNWLVPVLGKDEAFRYMLEFKYHAQHDRKPEIDHIHPISKGGAALGLDNHQAICYTCHKAKTSVDNSGPRKS